MRRLVALAFVLSLFLPAAMGAVGPYSAPANAGAMHPFGAPANVETESIDLRATQPFSRFTVEAHDWLDAKTWMKVCLRYGSTCIRTAEGDDRIVIDAPEGAPFPANTVARIFVYTAHAWADGDASVATWGGVRAQFEPEPVLTDIVPYSAAGYGGQVGTLLPINLRIECGHLVGAQCAIAPVTAKSVRIEVVDEVAEDTYFEACLFMPNGATIQCVPASNIAQMLGVPAGGMVDVRPYAALGSKPAGTIGHVKIMYTL